MCKRARFGLRCLDSRDSNRWRIESHDSVHIPEKVSFSVVSKVPAKGKAHLWPNIRRQFKGENCMQFESSDFQSQGLEP